MQSIDLSSTGLLEDRDDVDVSGPGIHRQHRERVGSRFEALCIIERRNRSALREHSIASERLPRLPS